MPDCCIIGGGIIGLSVARELAGRGHGVRVLSRDPRRDTASWAAAGIFPPAPWRNGLSPGDALTAWSDRLHREWARDLRAQTGIDTGLEACGGLHLTGDESGWPRLDAEMREWLARGAACERLDGRGAAECEPTLAWAVDRGTVIGGYVLPEEMQMRPPRHLEALERSCLGRGVTLLRDAEVDSVEVGHGRVTGLQVRVEGVSRSLGADVYVFAAGAWSGGLADALGLHIETRPIRGQIALLKLPRQVLARVVNRGLDYLVPRVDGSLLVGSTIEDVGFDCSTVDAAIGRLLGVARDLLGDVADTPPEQVWAGLRPGSTDGLPSIGRTPACDNAYVAAGHFRAGLHQSTGTAVLVADMIEGRASAIDPTPFRPDRPRPASGTDAVAAYVARAAAEAAGT
jgi:glycine oxidase